MKNQTKKPTVTFKIIGITALIWNLIGVFAYLSQVYMTAADFATLPQNEQNYYANQPAWVTGAFALAVFAGSIGSLVLLLKKKWSIYLFIISLISILSESIFNFFIQTDMPVTTITLIMPILILGVAVFLVWYAKDSTDNGILI